MGWEVEYTNHFETWWETLTEDEQETVAAHVAMLELTGTNLRFPYSSDIRGSKYRNLRELRIQHKGKALRILYAFDPRRMAMFLIGGDQVGDERSSETFMPLAEKLYAVHLHTLQTEDIRIWQKHSTN